MFIYTHDNANTGQCFGSVKNKNRLGKRTSKALAVVK